MHLMLSWMMQVYSIKVIQSTSLVVRHDSLQQSCTVEHVQLTTKLGSTGRGNSKKTLDQVELWYTMWHKDDTEVFLLKTYAENIDSQ